MKQKIDFRSSAMIGLYISIGFLLLIYFGLAIFFHSHYLPNTTINSISCGWKTTEDLKSANRHNASRYVLTITDRNGKDFTLSGANISYGYNQQGEETNILKAQNPFTWPVALFQEQEYTLSTSVQYDTSLAEKVIGQLGLFDEEYIQAPKDAYIKMNENGYEVIPEVMGTTPISDEKIKSMIFTALNASDSHLILSDDCYINPSRYADAIEIKTATETMDKYMKATITYEIEGVEEDLSSEEIFQFLKLHDDFSITIDTAKIDRFVQQLATKYNTYGDRREFTTSKGDVITIGGGDYGWVINKKKEAKQILSDLENGIAVIREPMYEQRAVQSGANDIGTTYIEVDYTNQHMWVYSEGELIMESDFVSGNMRNGNGSPDGVFKIVYKQRNAVLRGEDYESPVSYFMPFAYNVGFHDADWRSSFGKQIYKTNGSHGCINLPPDFAKRLYEFVEVGMPVITYYRENITLTSENAKISNAFSYKK